MNPAETPVMIAPRTLPASPGITRLKPKRSFVAALLMSVVAWASPALHSQVQTYTFSTIAGIGGRQGVTNGTGGGIAFALFRGPTGVAVNSAGVLYVTDSGNQLIRRLATTSGGVTTLAGTVGQNGMLDGTGISASFNAPQGPALDAAGNLYVADFSNSTIRKITPAGVVTTFAGLALSAGVADGTGTGARFRQPSGVAVDGSGNVYVADSGNHTIRKITSAGVVTTLAGTSGISGSADGTGTAASFNFPRSVAVDASGNVFVADTKNNSIRQITTAGVVTTIAGKSGTYGGTDDKGDLARFNYPNGLILDAAGAIYVADELNHTIRKLMQTGTADKPVWTVSTFAGQAATPGSADGTSSVARFNQPTGITLDAGGSLYVADYTNSLIRKVSPAGVVSTVAGVIGNSGAIDGLGYNLTPVLFSNPSGTAVDSSGNVYVSDTFNNMIRRINSAGVVTTLAGNFNAVGRLNGNGTSTSFNAPAGLATAANGNVYVADTVNHLIRLITPVGDVSTFAGNGGVAGSDDGVGTAATFNLPSAVAVDAGYNVYVADYNNNTIRKITPGGSVTTLAGLAGSSGSADGVGSAARFYRPRGIAVDGAGYVYVADSGNQTIRKISPAGFVQTFAGAVGVAGSSDGAGIASARFNTPTGLAIDGAGNIYVTDTNNSTIRQITPSGVVSTVGGIAGSASNVDGVGAIARFDHPVGVAADPTGTLYIADTRNQTIRKGNTPTSSIGSGGSGSGGGGTGGTGGAGGSDGNGGGNGGTGGSGGLPGTGSGFFLHPSSIVVAGSGRLMVADTANNSIKSIAGDGTVTVFVGKIGSAGSADGTGTAASFNGPTGMVTDSAGNIYVCDTGNATIRKVTSAGVVTTIAGSAGSRGILDGTGSAAQFSTPTGVAIDTTGNLFVTDSANCTLRKITAAGVVTTYAGAARVVGDADGLVGAARFNNPTGLVINSNNVLFVADTYNSTIRKIYTVATSETVTDPITGLAAANSVPEGTVTTFAGSAGISGAYDGIGAFALFNLPTGVSLDSFSNVVVADTGNNCIRRITGGGHFVTTIAGIAGIAGLRNGSTSTALFNQPQAILYSTPIIVVDTGNSVLRTVSESQFIVATMNLKEPVVTTTPTPTPPASSSGGGGASAPWFVAALLTLFACRLSRSRDRSQSRG